MSDYQFGTVQWNSHFSKWEESCMGMVGPTEEKVYAFTRVL